MSVSPTRRDFLRDILIDRLPDPTGVPRIPPAVIAAVALLLALVVGRFFADGHTNYAAALVLGICYGPLVLSISHSPAPYTWPLSSCRASRH